METKISDCVEYSLDSRKTTLTNKLWFVDGFTEQGDFMGTFIVTEDNDLLKDWKGIFLQLIPTM